MNTVTAIESDASTLGFAFYSISPRVVPPEITRSIISSLPPLATTVGVFVEESFNKVEPYEIDESFGVGSSIKGKKDRTKLRLFIEKTIISMEYA